MPQRPIWMAALLAVEWFAEKDGESCPVEWQCARNYMRFTGAGAVVLQPLNISLRAGEVLELRWPRGETGYSFVIRRPRGIAKIGKESREAHHREARPSPEPD
jgi:hypothetical protein